MKLFFKTCISKIKEKINSERSISYQEMKNNEDFKSLADSISGIEDRVKYEKDKLYSKYFHLFPPHF